MHKKHLRSVTRLVLCMAIVSGLASNALARVPAPTGSPDVLYFAFGVGGTSCASMTDNVQKTVDGAAAFREWINGYLTAVNYFLVGKVNYFEGLDKIAAYKFVLKYCEDNPLEKVLTGVHKLLLHYKIPLQ